MQMTILIEIQRNPKVFSLLVACATIFQRTETACCFINGDCALNRIHSYFRQNGRFRPINIIGNSFWLLWCQGSRKETKTSELYRISRMGGPADFFGGNVLHHGVIHKKLVCPLPYVVNENRESETIAKMQCGSMIEKFA